MKTRLTARRLILSLTIVMCAVLTMAAVAYAAVAVQRLKGGATTTTAVASSSEGLYFSQQGTSGAVRAWVDLPGAATTVSVPGTAKGLILATFSHQLRCTGGPAPGSGWGCEVRVLVDGQVASPGLVTTAAGFGNADYEQIEELASMQWSVLGTPGSHTVKVQMHTAVGVDTIQVQYLTRAWHLTTQVSKQAVITP